MHVTVTIVQTSHLSLCVFRVGSPSFLVCGLVSDLKSLITLLLGHISILFRWTKISAFGVVVNTFEDIASFHVFLD
jgi:hypothetical protein